MFISAFRRITELELIPEDLFYVTVNGKIVDWKSLDNDAHFQVHFRLRGGKGGFGSLLRSFRIHRSTNQLMCRDLSGRRLADIKEEEKLRKWIEKADEREEEKRRQEKYEKLKAGPKKHDFNDPDFIQTREKIMEETDEAFEQGIAIAKSRRTDEECLLKSKQKMKVDQGDDLGEGNVPSKRRRMTTNEVSEYVISTLDDENKNKVDVTDGRKIYVENEEERASPRIADMLIAEKSNATVEKACNETMNFDIKLDDYDDAKKLESLGLDFLKHALKVRGLKCGGSLHERAVRLYSVKNLKPEQYPKNILARGKKE
uniref:Bm4312 n=1 Tax=Brugia malayi TaxID=6279 RepID=A0A0J9XUG6_BRUMA|nr:Bm4312 [Brugia malayi]